MTTAISNDLRARLLDRLRYAEQYLEAARLMVQDTRELLEAVERKENDHVGGRTSTAAATCGSSRGGTTESRSGGRSRARSRPSCSRRSTYGRGGHGSSTSRRLKSPSAKRPPSGSDGARTRAARAARGRRQPGEVTARR